MRGATENSRNADMFARIPNYLYLNPRRGVSWDGTCVMLRVARILHTRFEIHLG